VVDDAKCILVTRVCVCLSVCLSVCLRVCLSLHRRMPTLLHGPGCNLENGRGASQLCTIGRIYNRWTGFVAMTTARTRNVSEWLYSLYAWFIITVAKILIKKNLAQDIKDYDNQKGQIDSLIEKSSAVAEMGDRGHNRHGPKRGGGCCAPFAERWEPV